MLRDVAIAHECKSLSSMVLETVRKECKYEVKDERGKDINVSGEVLGLDTIKELGFNPTFPEDIAYQTPCILCFSVTKEEIRKIQAYAHEQHFIGVPSFVLWLLRKKGFISEKS